MPDPHHQPGDHEPGQRGQDTGDERDALQGGGVRYRRLGGARPVDPGTGPGPAADGGVLGGVTIRTAPVAHPVEAYALRVEHEGASLVYSGDTGPCAALVELAQGADVLLCEASWPHVVPGRWTKPPGDLHMSGRQAGEHAAAAGVGRLLITHVPMWCDPAALLAEARAAFGGPVELVAPDVSYEV